MADRFGPLLHRYREAAGMTQVALARAVGVNSGYISRLEAGERLAPAAELVQALAQALALPPGPTDRLLATAGYLPPSLARVDLADPTLRLVLRLLTDEQVPEAERAEFREIIRLVAHRWLPEA